ncbi:MAG: beta-galactosidase, partial [Armatimonadota bacterium]|nr:beta-galactosidase [Armatimonadota bacterium]
MPNSLPRALLLTLLFSVGLTRLTLAAPPETDRIDLSSAANVAWQFKAEGGDWKPIVVPGGGWRAQGYVCDAGTYRAIVPIPKDLTGRMVRLKFAAVNFGADISVGPDDDHLTKIASHVDGWVPVVADVTPFARPGQPLHVQVDVKGRNKFKVNGKYIVPEGATWDPYLEEGILRGVHLELLPTIHVDDVFVRTSVTARRLQPTVTVTNASPRPATVMVLAKLLSTSQAHFAYPKIAPISVTLAGGETRAVSLGSIAWTLGPSSYWWPNVPYRAGYRAQMHVLDVSLKVDGETRHHAQQSFGFRQFEARGNHYYLNGIRCNLRGDNQQEADFGTDGYGIRPGFGPPSPGNGGWPQAVDNLQRLNFNVMRIHQIPATPYMLDVCDQKGLMLVEESPLRGSEGGEDFAHGHDNMLNMDRELVQRDRNHPAIVVWSAANEWAEPIKEAVPVIQAVDDTRPIIADGVGDMGAPYINMSHYQSGFNVLPDSGGPPRADRPYGETEAVWPGDNTRQGFAWMATSIRTRRLKGDADLRNYVLNNAWPNYVPGETPENEVLEVRVKGNPNATILPAIADPWHNTNIRLLQQCYNPVAACDVDFDQKNKRSNKNGDWPVVQPRLAVGSHVVRHLAVFNDEFSGGHVQVSWEVHRGAKTGPLLKSGHVTLPIPLGEFAMTDIAFDAPQTPGPLCLILSTV